MDELKDKIIMVLYTKYKSIPKRLLLLAYIIYKNNEEIKKQVLFVNNDQSIFKANEYEEEIKFYGLSNKFLKDNCKSLEEVLDIFYKDLKGVNILCSL